MRALIFAGVLCFITGVSWADTYVIKQDDGSLAVVDYVPTSSKSLDQILMDSELFGKPIKKVKPSDFPPFEDRNFWTLDAQGKLIVDNVKKQAWQANEAAKETKRQAVRDKMKITKQDWDELNAK